MSQLVGSILMVLVAIAVQIVVTVWLLRKMVARLSRPYLGGKTWTEPLLDETDQFIEEMDKKLEQPPMWRWTPPTREELEEAIRRDSQ